MSNKKVSEARKKKKKKKKLRQISRAHNYSRAQGLALPEAPKININPMLEDLSDQLYVVPKITTIAVAGL